MIHSSAIPKILLLIYFKFFLTLALHDIKFIEEPVDSYVTKKSPAILKCKIENASTGYFKCNDQWSQDPALSKIVQIGNKQILTVEQKITKELYDEFINQQNKKDTLGSVDFWCSCHGWLNSVEDKIVSRKAKVKLACKSLYDVNIACSII